MMYQYYREEAGWARAGGGLERVVRPAPFAKPAGIGPVRGGRWSVRKLKHTGYWRAWTQGSARRWNRKFWTQTDAMAWAQMVAYAFKMYPPVEANERLQAIWNVLKLDAKVAARELQQATH